MKKSLLLCLAAVSLSAMAQETYENAQLATQDLNGTARYVGMGGAMEALGADITTINTNPAGVGLFRRSWIGVSAGVTSQNGDDPAVKGLKYSNGGKTTNVDLNQIGFVYSASTGRESRVNLAFNYNRSRNFNQIITATNLLRDASASKRAFVGLASWQAGTGYNPVKSEDPRTYHTSLQDQLIDQVVNSNLVTSETDQINKETWYYDGYEGANAYATSIDNSGYISDFDFNISGNHRDRFFYGLTLGIKDIHYKNSTMYDEVLSDVNNNDAGDFFLTNERRITGSGINIKAGIIFRPVESSPFRIGLYLNTPTWYSLNCQGTMSLSATANNITTGNAASKSFAYKYKMNTPWKFGVSAGTTVSDKLAIGVTYEYSDYSSIKNRINEGMVYSTYRDYWGEYDSYYEASTPDRAMNDNTDASLRGVSLLKVGLEFKPVRKIALRAGYNFQSAIYKDSGSKDVMIDPSLDYGSVGNYYTTYDYTNWKSTQRVTFGLGFMLSNNVNLDLSYQYAVQNGEYHPFESISSMDTYINSDKGNSAKYNMNPEVGSEVYVATSLSGTPSKVNNNRHQFNATLSYRF